VSGSLAGTRLLVVGASSGVGRAIGLAAAAAGASVAFAARRLELLQTAVDEAGPSSLAIVCDVTDPTSVVETVEGAVQALGGIDAVVYATGVDPLIRIEDVEAAAWSGMGICWVNCPPCGTSEVMSSTTAPVTCNATKWPTPWWQCWRHRRAFRLSRCWPTRRAAARLRRRITPPL
jgi:NADP-dependent 3-hydroxy acid dehydrogenase YdfG